MDKGGGAVLHEQIQASTSLCMLFVEVEASREGDVRESPASLGVLSSWRVTGAGDVPWLEGCLSGLSC